MKRGIIALLLLTPSALQAETVTVGPAELTVPPGWTVKPGKGKVMTFEHPGKRGEAASILVLPADARAAGVDKSFLDFAKGVTQNNAEAKYVTQARTPDGWLARKTVSSFTAKAKGNEVRLSVTVIGLQGQKHFVGFALMAASSDTRRKLEPALLQIANTMKLNDAPAATVPPKTTKDLDGLYAKFGITNALSPLGGMTIEATRDYLDFLPGGFVFRDLPPAESINRPTADALRKAKPKECGTYSFDGSKLTLTFPDDNGWLRDETDDFKTTKNGFESGGNYFKLEPMTGKRVDGTFRSFNYVGGDGSTGTSGGVASERFITFRPDGTYEQQGSVAVAMTVEGGGGRTGIAGNSKKTPTRGTYAFDGYTVTFTPTTGEKVTKTLYQTDDKMLVIDDTAYLRGDDKKK